MAHFISFSVLLLIIGTVFANNPRVSISSTDPPINPTEGVIVQQTGKDVQLTCVVEDKPSDSQVQWGKSNRARNESNVAISSATKTEDAFAWSIDQPSATSWRLRVQNVQAEDEGLYECKVEVISNNYVLDRRYLRVVDKPQIKDLDTSTDMTKTTGESASLDCFATGRPTPTIRWTRMAGELLPNGGSVLQTNTMYIKEVKSNDAGWYKCSASNFAGKDERLILLTVKFVPEVSTNAMVVKQKVGYVKQLVCNVKGYPLPTDGQIRWTKSGAVLKFDDRVQKRNIVGAYNRITSIVDIRGVKSSDYGRYECSAVNDIGRSTKTVAIELVSSPVATQDRSHRIVNSVSMVIANIALTALTVLFTCILQGR